MNSWCGYSDSYKIWLDGIFYMNEYIICVVFFFGEFSWPLFFVVVFLIFWIFRHYIVSEHNNQGICFLQAYLFFHLKLLVVRLFFQTRFAVY